ncbi:Rossmann-like and DUF2520 domain-containing protein [Arsenicibacter rosenii]|uniref:Glycerol-3-phosphate dehydrogenase n=1 Tax=Arsenicibacter rosenii TaxID=1750698 RepID=A0A1S2VR71_9BACT|nr:Rossmann-like and DUF2520 domain-containing protein [Arsenicibacter rosenii]OIN60288.1 glycerol-3-phosphate dehydrogenase [Arsenicibacter rosenii]
MHITFIGAGNLAWHLAPAFENAGHQINEVYSRRTEQARRLISILYDAGVRTDLNFADSSSQLFVLAVADDAMEEVCQQLVLPENAIVVHVSGAKPLAQLRRWMAIYSDVPVRTGVFYPLQTFSRDQPPLSFEQIPLCLEADDKETEDILVGLGQELSDIVYLITSDERRLLHMAAVFACNFTNHLLAIAKDLTETNEVPFKLLKPLIRETIRKGLSAGHPADVQTGPARRGDQQTMQAHLTLLSDQPQLAEMYELMSDSIARMYH